MGPHVSKAKNQAHNVHGLRGHQYSYSSSNVHPPVSLVDPDRRNSLLSTHGDQGGSITTHLLALLVDTSDVGAAGDVPHGDVLFHAAGQAATLLG
jgi:hypothetical protein